MYGIAESENVVLHTHGQSSTSPVNNASPFGVAGAVINWIKCGGIGRVSADLPNATPSQSSSFSKFDASTRGCPRKMFVFA
jgi:hypothetical protein